MVVLDASALLAPLLGEPGADKVEEAFDGAATAFANLAEVVSRYAKLAAARPDIGALLRPPPIRVVPVDAALSYEAWSPRRITLKKGLSPGDRYRLAAARRGAARREGVPARPRSGAGRGALHRPHRRDRRRHGRP